MFSKYINLFIRSQDSSKPTKIFYLSNNLDKCLIKHFIYWPNTNFSTFDRWHRLVLCFWMFIHILLSTYIIDITILSFGLEDFSFCVVSFIFEVHLDAQGFIFWPIHYSIKFFHLRYPVFPLWMFSNFFIYRLSADFQFFPYEC